MQMSKLRRIITGHNDQGKSIVAIEGPAAEHMGSESAGLGEIWATDSAPARNAGADDMGKGPIRLNPAPLGSKFRWFAVAPENPDASRADMEAASAAMFEQIGATGDRVDTSKHPGMHKTRTTDYIVVVSGNVTLLLDEDEVALNPGDVVVQRGTNHAWINKGSEPALLVGILIDAEPL